MTTNFGQVLRKAARFAYSAAVNGEDLLTWRLLVQALNSTCRTETVLTTFVGHSRLQVPAATYDGRLLFLYRHYEPLTTWLFRRLLRPGALFVDVGALWGYFTLVAAEAVGPQGLVAAVEPNPRNLRILLHNCQLNNLQNVRIFPLALGDSPSSCRLVQPELHPGAGRIVGACAETVDPGGPLVQVARGDDVLPEPRSLTIVKVDVEGAEARVLRGMESFLERRCFFVVEALGRARFAAIGQLMHEYGYHWVPIQPGRQSFSRSIADFHGNVFFAPETPDLPRTIRFPRHYPRYASYW